MDEKDSKTTPASAAAPSEPPAEPAADSEPKPGKGLWALWCALLAAALAALCLSVLSFRFQTRFFPHTELLGRDVSRLTAADAGRALAAEADTLFLSVLDDSGFELCRIPLSSCVGENELHTLAQRTLSEQHLGRDFLAWLSGERYSYEPAFLSDMTLADASALLETWLYSDREQVLPQDAVLLLEDDGYTVQAAVEGNTADLRRCSAALLAELTSLNSLAGPPAPVVVEGGRVLPDVTAEDPAVAEPAAKLDRYLGTEIVLDFGGGQTYTLTQDDIWSLSSVRRMVGSVVIEPVDSRVREFTENLIELYGVDGVYAKFRNAEQTREYIYYRVGDTGWIMDRQGLADDICAALRGRNDSVIAPRYDCTWYWKDYYRYNRLGDTFVEISLDNQYMWYFLNGEPIVETPVVTGNLSTGSFTHRGYYWIVAKVQDVNLTGPTWNDHVEYWMPFDIPHEIGLHDSSWRDEYGGDIYMTDGSHGCVNTPLEAMETIYNNIWEAVPVIVY